MRAWKIGVLLVVAAAAGARAQEPAGTWGTDLDAALREADAAGRILVVKFHAPWCPWCAKMERDTFADRDVQDRLERFVAVAVNTDDARDVAQRFGVEGLPATLLLNGRGQVLARLDGYQTPALFAPVLDEALAGRLVPEEPRVVEPSEPEGESGMENPLPGLAERMWDVKRGHLDSGDPGPITQAKEREILEHLDELIEQAEST